VTAARPSHRWTNDQSPTAAAIRDYIRRVKIACDEWHDDPLDPEARAALRAVIEEDVPALQ